MAWTARALFVLLIAGAIASETFHPTRNVGDSLAVQVFTGMNTDVPCYLTTPQGETIEFRPENQSTDRIVYAETPPISYCGANINNLSENDQGEWSIYFVSGDNKTTNTYHLTVNKSIEDTVESVPVTEPAEEVTEEDNTQWLTTINHVTRTGLYVDISLSKKDLDASQEETFTLTTPENQDVELENANIPGVKVQSKSYFVASRVTIGPMDSSLIGLWVLCGKLNTGAKRCQQVNLSWNSISNPSMDWDTRSVETRDTVTNYLATVYSSVSGSGNLFTCHLVTPNGEDLVITSDSAYPGITLVPHRDTSICTISFGPIHQEFIGNWTMYARFRLVLSGVNEVRLPLHMFLYDEQNPYNQAYNVTTLDPVTRVVNLGITTNLEVTGSGNIDNCAIRSPAGETFDLLHSTETVKVMETGSRTGCAVSLGPIQESTLGEWQIVGKFSNNGVFTEMRQNVRIIQEDPANPIIEEHRRVSTKDSVFYNTSLGAEHVVVAEPEHWIYDQESCHLRTPSGLQYTIMDGFDHPGVEILKNSDNKCEVKINVESENLIGEWVLISRETHTTEAVEIRQPFTIHVEEKVDAATSQVTVHEGNDLHVRLANPTNLHESCRLYGPNGEERTDIEVDKSHVDSCGFIVRNIQDEESGLWEIRYGTGILYRAFVNVEVTDSWKATHDTIVLPRGRSVNQTIGPETAVYCKLTDPTGRLVYEGFGMCNLVLDRVSNDHAGVWIMNVGLQGTILTREYRITAQVRGMDDKPTVTTHVIKEEPQVLMTCSVPVEYEVRACLFREPSGRVILASEGVAEDRYIFHGSGTSVNSNVTTHECGLRITNPVTADLGLWRCAVQTNHEVYYGFLTVLCPWAMQDPATAAAVVSVPTLTAHETEITKLEGDSMSLSCYIQSPIRYCYFRARNGTVINVSPGISSGNFEYIGAGLDAGECGIRFNRMARTDAGRWSCHVGLPDPIEPEQRVNIEVQITPLFEVNQTVTARGLRVEGHVVYNQAVEYCRYVRMDGLGFTSATLPNSRYISLEDVNSGLCAILIAEPNILEMHPWAVVAKVVGKEDEVSGVTTNTIQMPVAASSNSKNFFLFWILVIALGTVLIIIGVLFIPPKNRSNTLARANAWRDSFRSSFRKAPLSTDDNRTTPMTA